MNLPRILPFIPWVPHRQCLMVWSGVCALGFLPVAGLPHGLELSVQQLSDSDSAGIVDERTLTVGEAKVLLAIRSARYRPGAALVYGMEDLADQIRYFPVYESFADQARAAGMCLTPEEESTLQAETEAFARLVLFEREIASRTPSPTLEMLRLLYEEIKDEAFHIPERLLIQKVVRHFEDVDSQEAEWEALKDAARELNDGATARSVFQNAGFKADSIVLHPGEEEDSDLVGALLRIDDRHALEPRQEDGALVLYYRQRGMDATHIPFQSSLEVLTTIYRAREHELLLGDYLKGLGGKPGLVRVIESNLASEGSLALPSDVLLVVAGEAITRGELQRALGWRINMANLIDSERFIEMALSTGVVQEHLLAHVIEADGLFDHHKVQFFHEQMALTLLARRILEPMALESPLVVSGAEALEQWRHERSTAGRLPGEVSYDRIKIGGNANLDEWRESFRDASTHEVFRSLANRLMREDSTAVWMAGLLDHVSDLPGDARGILDAMEFPAAIVAESGAGEVNVYWLREANPDEIPSALELERSREMLRKYRLQNRIEAILEEASTDFPVRIHLPISAY